MEKELKKIMKTNIIGKNIIYYKEIDSTQTKAKKLAEDNVENGTIVLADKQNKGIGTHERKWYTGKGKNIAFSIIIYPKCKIQKLESLTIDLATYMIETIEELYHNKLDIKKPNDLMYNGKKVGGILTQVTSFR